MNILLLSDLYPMDAGHSRRDISHALHDFAKQWSQTQNVLVLRPFIVPDWQGKNRKVKSGMTEWEGVKIWHAPVPKLPRLHCFFLAGLHQALRASGFRPQVIVAHLGFNLLFASRLAQRLRVPLIAAVHLGDLLHGPAMLGERRLRAVFRHASGIACRSPIILRRFSEKYPDLAQKCFVANSGIESSWLESPNTSEDRFAGWPTKKTIVFCTIASLLECKNIAANLRVLAQLPPAIQWHYKIVGDGPEKNALLRLASSLGIAGRVDFMGFLSPPGVRRELLSSHIFLMVSRDTFGLAFLEAMACGLLVVGGRGYGIDGILEDGKNGFLCSPGDQAELASLLESIINHSDFGKLKSIVTKARETVSQYTIETAAANYLKNITQAIQNKSKG